MNKFSNTSLKRLNECHEDLIILFNEVIKEFDCTICVGYRNEEDQNKAYLDRKSDKKYPYSKHNKKPSLAVDVAPYSKKLKAIDWSNKNLMYFFAGFVLGKASELKKEGKIRHEIICGADWDNDRDITNHKLIDINHFEIKI